MNARYALAGIALAIIVVSGCNPKPSGSTSATPSPSPSPTASGLSLIVKGHGTSERPVRFVQSDRSNRRQYDLSAQSFQSAGSPGTELITFERVHVVFHGKDGSLLQADAPRAVLDQRADTVDLTGGVSALNSNGMKLSCDELLYDRKTEMIHGNGNVSITNAQGFRATGTRFDSDISLTHTRMQ